METMQTNLKRAVETRAQIGDWASVMRLKWIELESDQTDDALQACNDTLNALLASC
jgi:hypothetical protein